MPNRTTQHSSDKLILHISIGLILLMLPLLASALDSGKQQYKIGIYPHLSSTHLQNAYQSVIKNLSQNLGHKIYFNANENTESFHQHLKNEDYDIIMVQPFDYIALRKQYGYIPLAALKDMLKGVIVTKKGGAIQTIQNLLGRKLLLPPESTAISYLTKSHLRHFGFDLNQDITIQYERSHIDCLQKLLLGFTDACATSPDILRFFERRMDVQFQVITQTPEIPNTLFAVHPRIDLPHRHALTKTLLNWKEAQKKAHTPRKLFRKVSDKDYDIVRRIKAEVDSD